ncbi:NAD(P)/FAD-dependent oxidoreductase [Ancylobacter vacuolatus]|uniref:NAD/FAD-dependent oxidoreductase n=1 Tax=Ancylobacter vacuolatus TaxID=223389 RepID=A0ABU0DGR1_9HYPH|nr:NAD(P)-binding protein [Ancylobacter vacuolatus]MDQ0347518.1 putative NAD/FAD-dependent oxidoreductase [Ancylobacter vacuolatus]
MKRIAIIGAGLSGLTLAHALKGRAEITVFEKARGPGGRTATRREGAYRFDHGAPCFTARTPAFMAWLAPLLAAGVVAEWPGAVSNLQGGRVAGIRHRVERLLVGVPGMNALAAHLAGSVKLQVGIDVAPLAAGAGPHPLASGSGEALGTFDLVISTAPAEQSRALFGAVAGGEAFPDVRMKPRHALMVALDKPWYQGWIAARVMDGPLRWITVDSSKPGRATETTSLVVQTRSRWSRLHCDTPAELLAPTLLHALTAALPFDLPAPALAKAHRWRSALVEQGDRPGPWISPDGTLAATGDWAGTSRIEEVCLAALDLAERLKKDLP